MDGTHKYDDVYGGDEENGSFNISDQESGSGARAEGGVRGEESGRENDGGATHRSLSESVREELKEENDITAILVLSVLGWYATFVAYNYYYKLFIVPNYQVDGANQILACFTSLSLSLMTTALTTMLNWRKGGKVSLSPASSRPCPSHLFCFPSPPLILFTCLAFYSPALNPRLLVFLFSGRFSSFSPRGLSGL